MDRKSELMVGAFVLIGFAFLFFISYLINPDILRPTRVYNRYKVRFSSSSGLKVQDKVFLAGMDVGRIRAIAIRENKVEVQFEIDKRFADQVTENTPVSIQTTSLLGGRRLSLGLTEEKSAPIAPLGELTNIKEGDLFGSLAGAAEEIGGMIRENRENIQATIKNLNEITAKFNDPLGAGIIPRLLHDKEMGESLKMTIQKIERISDNIESISKTLRDQIGAGKSLLSKLIKDEEMGKKFTEIVTRIERASKSIDEITAKVNDPAGEGLIPRLIHDKELADAVNGAVSKIQGAADEVQKLVKAAREGEGSLGKFIKDPAVFDNIKNITADLKEMIAKVKRGEGSLGQIVMKDDIADNLNRLLKGAGEAIEDAREQAPIAAFGTVLLGGIQ